VLSLSRVRLLVKEACLTSTWGTAYFNSLHCPCRVKISNLGMKFAGSEPPHWCHTSSASLHQHGEVLIYLLHCPVLSNMYLSCPCLCPHLHDALWPSVVLCRQPYPCAHTTAKRPPLPCRYRPAPSLKVPSPSTWRFSTAKRVRFGIGRIQNRAST